MTKKEFVDIIAEKSDLKKYEAEKALNAVVETIMGKIADGDTVKLVGFGTFYSAKKEASTARNPKTGETVKVPAKTVPKFKFSTTYKKSFAK